VQEPASAQENTNGKAALEKIGVRPMSIWITGETVQANCFKGNSETAHAVPFAQRCGGSF
jgi:hypothetical protein